MQKKIRKGIKMKAYITASVAVLGLGLLGLSHIDLLLSEPFGSLMVFSRTLFLFGILAGLYGLTWLRNDRRRQPVRVRA
jgi:uncharacterized membrane protein YuzA (DUF378 family)